MCGAAGALNKVSYMRSLFTELRGYLSARVDIPD